MSEKTSLSNISTSSDELTLKDIVGYMSFIRPHMIRIFILLVSPVFIFSVLGVLASITTPKEYDAQCILLTDQVASSRAGSLSSLIELPNVDNLVSEGVGLGADLYPMILSNKPFLVELSNVQMNYNKEKGKVSFREYFKRPIKKNILETAKEIIFNPFDHFRKQNNEKSTNSFNSHLINSKYTNDLNNTDQFFSNEAYIAELTSEDKKMIAILTQRIKFVQDGKKITLSVKMPEPNLSAEATKAVLNLMMKYITKFKSSKQLDNLQFLEKSTAEAEIKYKKAQQRLAGFKDNNYNVIFESIQSKEQQLQNEFSLAFSIYNQFVTQLEQTRIQLKKETPLFTIVEPVYIPEAVSTDPNKAILSYASTGLLIGIFFNFIFVIRIIFRIRNNKVNNISK
jgi:hypothetical protein